MKNRSYLMSGVFVITLLMSGCSYYMNSFANNLNQAVKSSNDPQTVMQALPSYIILIDGLIKSDPDNEDRLIASASLMNSYASLLGAQMDLIEDLPDYHRDQIIAQQKILNKKALSRAERALCLHNKTLCDLTHLKYDVLKDKLKVVEENDTEILYSVGTAWVSWLQVNTDDWNALAQIAQIKLVMQNVVEHNDSIDNGNAHVYLGVLNSLIPASLGGNPAVGKQHFEAAIRLSHGDNLMAKALYAQYYARLMFDEELHQRLTSDVLSVKDSGKELSLISTLAVEKSKALQRSAPDYF